MNNQTKKIISLYSQKCEKDILELDTDGIIGDKHYGKDQNRSILITSIDSYKLVKENNINLNHGDLGENILVNFNPYTLLVGTKIKIGDVILEISQKSTLCKSLTKIDNKLPKLLKDDRGIFARVLSLGVIKKGDNINIL